MTSSNALPSAASLALVFSDPLCASDVRLVQLYTGARGSALHYRLDKNCNMNSAVSFASPL